MKPAADPRPEARDLIAGYRPLPGAPDELLARDGTVRPAWLPFLDHLGALSDEELALRFARGDEYLRDAGVFFRQYGQKGAIDRAWPLSHIPVILHEREWEHIVAALVERADLLEAVAADIYGPNRLVGEGALPASLLAENPEWLRPMLGVRPAGGAFLNFIAFDIGRGPDGNWWVLDDRVQAPSGAGFALENRVATARVYSDFYPEANVHRLAGFFRQFRDALADLRGADDDAVAILSAGPMTDTYYEHAYIARYLGLGLVEGEDLAVQNGRVAIRSVSGARPVGVLWRRLDSTFSDPLEFDPASRLGTPGLMGAVRDGSLAIVNALGVGALEAKAFFAFLPRLAELLLGRPLAMPNVATWWCGQEAERRYVEDNRGRMLIGPATAPLRLANGVEQRPFAGDPDRLTAQNGHLFVGQELVTLSTAPTWADGRLAPRPMSLRVYLARTRAGWVALPGGFARIGRSDDPKAVAMREGGSVADVWIVSDHPVPVETMAPDAAQPYVRPRPGALPSRAADNLFWLGRYVERAEGAMRLLRAYFARLSDADELESPLVAYARGHMESLGIEPDEAVPPALLGMLDAALGSAAKVRERFSVDGWMALNDLAESARRIRRTAVVGDDSARAMGVLLRKITGFSGLVHENMYRFLGWRFLTLGRSLERALSMCALMRVMTAPAAPQGALDFAVEVADSTQSHRRRYTVRTTRATVIDLLGLDDMNPRSIIYQLNELREQVELLPGAHIHGQMSELMRAVFRIETLVAGMRAEEMTVEELDQIQAQVGALSELITESYLR